MKWDIEALKTLAKNDMVPGISLRDAIAEIERITKREYTNCATIIHLRDELKSANMENERLRDVLENKDDKIQKIVNWAEAYPIDIFPELTKDDWKKVREALTAKGLCIDAVSTSNMRHVVKGVEAYAREALKGGEE